MENLLPALGHVVRQLQKEGRRDILSTEALLNRLTGDINAGMLLRHLLYWFPKAKHPGGWVYKSAKDWGAECAISEGAVKRIHNRRLLEAVGIERDLKKANGVPTNHYRLDLSAFIAKLSHFLSVPIETLRSWLAGDTAQSTQSTGQRQSDEWADSTLTPQHEPSDAFGADDPIHSAQSDHSLTSQNHTSLNNSLYTETNNNNMLSVVSLTEEEFQEDLPQVPNITPQMMKQLVTESSMNRARAVIAYANKQPNLRNPAGFIVARIRDGKLGLEHPDQVSSSWEDNGKRFITGEYADFIKH